MFKNGFPEGRIDYYTESDNRKRIGKTEERLLTVNIPEIETSLRKAAEVHKEARSYIQNRIKPGIRFWDMCCDLEHKVRFLIGENGPNVRGTSGVQCRLAWGSRRAAPLTTSLPTTRRTRTTCRDCSTAT